MITLHDTFNTSQSIQTYLLACMTTVTAILCVIILVVVWCNPKLHTLGYWLFAAVAIPDLLQSLGVTGIFWSNAVGGGWNGSQARCDAQAFFSFAFVYLDAATVVWISIHRYQLIVTKQFWSLRMYTLRGLFNITCAITVGLYGILIRSNLNTLQSSGIMCSIRFGDTSSAANLWPTIHLFIGTTVVLISISYCYIQIYCALAEASRATKQSMTLSRAHRRNIQEIKTSIKLFCIVLVWVIQSLPLFIIVCGGLNGYIVTPTMSSLVAFSIHSNALLNSVVFFIDYNAIHALLNMLGFTQLVHTPITSSNENTLVGGTRKINTVVPKLSTPKVSYRHVTTQSIDSYSNQRVTTKVMNSPTSQLQIRIDTVKRHTDSSSNVLSQLDLNHFERNIIRATM